MKSKIIGVKGHAVTLVEQELLTLLEHLSSP